jgi:fatty acid desaturase
MPIPDRLNSTIAGSVLALAVGLLWLGSWVESWYAVAAVGVAFSYLLLTNYALLHEAAHHNLHSHRAVNRALGEMAGMLFPLPYTMMESTHQGHHLRNRTDYEMFDLYYPTDSRLVRYVQWYGVLCGFFWPIAPLGALVIASCPALLRSGVFRRARSSSYLLGDIRAEQVRAIRWEVAATVVFFAALFWLLGLRWQNTLILYGCFAVNWSTRQYVGHAFSKRDVIEGAYNLRHNRLMSWILLNGEWDLNHHRRPEISWFYLPAVSQDNDPRPSYIRQYWRQWRGPRPNTEPAPESLQELPLSIHS